MILSKLQEALLAILHEDDELEQKREKLKQAAAALRSVIASISDTPSDKESERTSQSTRSRGSKATERDGLDDIIDILREAGTPLHINAIAERLSTIKHKPIKRTQIEPGLNRHVTKAKTLRVDKFGPSIFGLPEWKESPIGKTA